MTRYDNIGFEPLPNVSIDDFDAVAEPHEFSASYQARKAALLGEYRAQCASQAQYGAASSACASRSHARTKRTRFSGWKFAIAAAAAALVALPAAGFAVANNADFFANAFGTGARESIAAHDESITQGEKTHTVTFPAREYVDTDPEEAERLLGDHVMTTPVEMMAGDHKITVLSAVRDDNSAVIHYTVSREGGVTALEFSKLSNEGKGAYIKNSADHTWHFIAPSADGTEQELNIPGSFTFVNEKCTTDDAVDCYAYITFWHGIADGAPITLEAWKRGGDAEGSEDALDATLTASVEIPVTDPLPSTLLTCDNGASVSVSAIGERLIGSETLVPDDELGGLDRYAASQTIAFEDGTEYLVYDSGNDIDNTSYGVGSENGSFTVFNRLVDSDAIIKITINGHEFVR